MQLVLQKMKNLWQAGGLHVILGNFFNKFVVFFGSVLIVRLLSKFEYGALSYIENLYNLSYILAGIGLSNAVLRYVVLEKDMEMKKAVFDFMSKTALCYNLFLAIILGITNYFYPHSQEFKSASVLLYIMLLMLPAQYFVDNHLTLKRAMFDNKGFAYYNFGYATIVILGKCLGAYSGSLLNLIVLGVIIQYVYAVLIYVNNRKKYFQNIASIKIKREKYKSIIVYAIQYMVTNGIWTLFMLMDIFLLGKILSDPIALANYKVAYTWPANISILCSAIGVFISPYFIKNEDNNEWIRDKFKKIFILNFIAVVVLAVIMCVLAKQLIFIYGGKDYYDVIPLMRFLLISSVINNGIRYMIANCLAAMGKIKANMIVSFLGILLQFGLDLYFIPRFGIYGPVYTSIIVYTIMAILLFVVFNRKYRIL